MSKQSVQERWTELDSKRQGLLNRCRRYAQLTIPAVFPPDNYSQYGEYLQTGSNSIGAQLVNNLSNKLMVGLFAPSRPFFRFSVSEDDQAEFEAQGFKKSQLADILTAKERDALSQFEELRMRDDLFELFLLLIITGNAMLVIRDEATEVFNMADYVVTLTRSGEPLEIIIRRKVQYIELEDVVRDMIPERYEPNDLIDVYTHVRKVSDDKFEETYHVDRYEITLPKYQGRYSKAKLPYFPQTWFRVKGSHYGIGLVEQYYSDFDYVDTLTTAELDLASLAAAYRWLLNPASSMRPEDLQRSVNGDVLPATPNDLSVMMATRGVDLSPVSKVINDKIMRLAAAFLYSTALRRDGERVTAEEIRMVINELDTSLGGVHTRLSQSLQYPLAIMLSKKVGLDDADLRNLKPTVVTGLDAISRNGDLEAKRLWVADMANFQSLQGLFSIIKVPEYARSIAADRGIDPSLLVYTDEEIQQAQQAEQEAQMAQMAAQAMMAGAEEQPIQEGQM